MTVKLFAIVLQRARIACKVIRAVKLHRINKHRDHDHISPLARFINQRQVAIMQIAHRGHQGDTLARLAPATDLAA